MPPRLASRLRPLRAVSINAIGTPPRFRRAFHEAKAEFMTLDDKASLTTRKLDIFIGDPHQSYIIFPPDVGFAMKSDIAKQIGVCLASDPEKVPLTFFHDSRHFAHAAVPYPRIVIEQDLPRQDASNTSPATLWLWGASHSITLDGTGDEAFEESCRESHERLKGAAELLRHR